LGGLAASRRHRPDFAGIGGYGNTAEGKLIAAALLDSFKQACRQLHSDAVEFAAERWVERIKREYTWQLDDTMDKVSKKFSTSRHDIMGRPSRPR